jgi:hypothetical protein
MGCLIAFSLSKPCKEGEGNKKDVSFCSLFHSLYWKFEKLYDNNTLSHTLSHLECLLRSFEQCQEDKQYGKAIGW